MTEVLFCVGKTELYDSGLLIQFDDIAKTAHLTYLECHVFTNMVNLLVFFKKIFLFILESRQKKSFFIPVSKRLGSIITISKTTIID
jgi:hypothetical protein